jgi:hypothetical protein
MKRGAYLVSLFSRRVTLIVLNCLTLGLPLWWIFRPELIFVNKHVNETAPGEIGSLEPVFTGEVYSVGDAQIRGRVDLVRSGGTLKLEILNLKSSSIKQFNVVIARDVNSWSKGTALGNITVDGGQKLILPAGIDPAVRKTVLLISDGHVAASAVLEPF